jgi:hypothetical protein
MFRNQKTIGHGWQQKKDTGLRQIKGGEMKMAKETSLFGGFNPLKGFKPLDMFQYSQPKKHRKRKVAKKKKAKPKYTNKQRISKATIKRWEHLAAKKLARQMED